MTQKHNSVLGSFEQVTFPDYNDYSVVAKIDTGAFTGALHCTKVFLDESGKEPVLHFSPFDHPEIEMTETDFNTGEVRSSNGDTETRYFINTEILIDGKKYPITLTLADRSEMKWPVLIGRRFLRDHKFLVDVNKPAK